MGPPWGTSAMDTCFWIPGGVFSTALSLLIIAGGIILVGGGVVGMEGGVFGMGGGVVGMGGVLGEF